MALYAQAGSAKTKRPTAQLVLLGILAGALIALGCAATNTAAYGIADTWTARMVCGLLFPFGLGMVIMSGAELFTGNCLIAISLLERQCTPAGMLRNWAIVYLSNFAGALLVAAGCTFFGQLNYSGGLLAVFTMKLAAGKCALPFQNAFVLAILCNLLVCLGVILAMTAKDTAEMGVDLSALTVGNFLSRNLLPVTLGNLVGGVGIAALLWYCNRKK